MAQCVPCKQELCSQKARAMLATGQWATANDKWDSDESLAAWVTLLDKFAGDAETLIVEKVVGS